MIILLLRVNQMIIAMCSSCGAYIRICDNIIIGPLYMCVCDVCVFTSDFLLPATVA